MLQGEHSAILSTFIKLPFVIKFFVLSIFEWPLKTGFTVHDVTELAGIGKQTMMWCVTFVSRAMFRTKKKGV